MSDVREKVQQLVERRATVRREVELHASLTAMEGPGDAVSAVGHTIDLSAGGCRILTDEPFPRAAEPTVTLDLGDGSVVVAQAAILERRHAPPPGYEYRLVFTDIDLDDRCRLADLVA